LKPEWWGSPLVQEKYQEEMPVTGDIIIIIIILSCEGLGIVPVP